MDKRLPYSLTVEDAVSLLINFPSLKAGSTRLDDYLASTDTFEEFDLDSVIFFYRKMLAEKITEAIDLELDKVRKGEKSDLEVEDGFGSEKVITASLCYWAATRFFIEVPESRPPMFWRRKNERRHTTEYLTIVDDIISTFCEVGGDYYEEGREPTNEQISVYVKEKYGDISNKVLSAIGTIIRPGIIFNEKRK